MSDHILPRDTEQVNLLRTSISIPTSNIAISPSSTTSTHRTGADPNDLHVISDLPNQNRNRLRSSGTIVAPRSPKPDAAAGDSVAFIPTFQKLVFQRLESGDLAQFDSSATSPLNLASSPPKLIQSAAPLRRLSSVVTDYHSRRTLSGTGVEPTRTPSLKSGKSAVSFGLDEPMTPTLTHGRPLTPELSSPQLAGQMLPELPGVALKHFERVVESLLGTEAPGIWGLKVHCEMQVRTRERRARRAGCCARASIACPMPHSLFSSCPSDTRSCSRGLIRL